MAKEIKTIVKLHIAAAKANPAPPVGPALAPHGINISEFCKEFNDKTQEMAGFKIPVEIKVFNDRTYKFVLKQPPAAELIKKELGIEKGSAKPNEKKVAKITKEQLKNVAEKKMPDLNTKDIEQAIKVIEGTARSMGIEIIN